MDALPLSARSLASLSRRREWAGARRDRHRKNPRCVVRATHRGFRSTRRVTRNAPRSTRSLGDATSCAGRRHRGVVARATAVVRRAVAGRDANRGYVAGTARPAAATTARDARHDAGESHAAAHARRRRRRLSRSPAHRRRRVARADGDETRRPGGARTGAAAHPVSRCADLGTLGDDRQPRRCTASIVRLPLA